MKIFVTGATGVLGRRVVPLLVGAGHQVTGVARSPEKTQALRRAGAEPVEVDLFDAESLRGAVAGHQAVCNLATHIPPMRRAGLPGAWRENDRIRREGSRSVAEAALAAGADRLVQESIAFQYADGGATWLDEQAPLADNPLLASAREAEANAARLTQAGGTGIVLRFALFYGSDASHTRDLHRLAQRGFAPVLGSPDAYTSSIHLDDAASAVLAALGAPAGTYNVGDDEPLTNAELTQVAAAAVGRRRLRRTVARLSRAGGRLTAHLRASQRIDARALREATGWTPQVPSAREGIPAVWAEIAGAAARA